MGPDDTSTDTGQSSTPAQAKPPVGTASTRTIVSLGGLSHRGKVSPVNEDAFLVMRFERTLEALLTNLPSGQIPSRYRERGYAMFVADGMGGTPYGDIASRTAISTLVDLIIQTPDWIMSPDGGGAAKVLRRMEERLNRLPDAFKERARLEPRLSGMGTTLTLAASLGRDLIVAHVGASRAYIFRRGHLLRLTKDQTVAQLLADSGVIRPEEVSKHYARRVLTGPILDAGKSVEAELHHVKLADGDQLLLCSDGLTEMVTEEKIAAVLERREHAIDACRALVNLALEAGGEDNVTAVLACYQIPEQ